MYVFGDITTDARVQRAANALAPDFDVTVLSHNKGKIFESSYFKNVLLEGCPSFSSLNYIATVWQAYKYIRACKPDIFYAHDYFSALLAKLLLDKKFCKRIVFDEHELIIPESGKKMRRRQTFFYRFEKAIVHCVDLVVCASEERGKLMQEHYHLLSKPLVINNISQLEISNNPNSVSILNGLQEFFTCPGVSVVYAGVVSRVRRIDELLKAVSELTPQFKLLIVGNGDLLEELRERAASYPQLVFASTGSVPYNCLGAILSRCDIGFLYYPADTLNNTFCASNKIYEYASVGLPMLSNDNPTVKAIMNEAKIGISTNNLVEGLNIISKDINYFKDNCQKFTENNQWVSEAERLRIAVKEIVY